MTPKPKRTQDKWESSRTPKKAKGHEEVLIENPNPPQVDPHFITLAAQQRYTKHYSFRSILCEQGILLDDYREAP